MIPNHHHRTLPREHLSSALSAIDLLKEQIQIGKDLLRNRPINETSYSAWENHTHTILKKSAGIDPLGMQRFSLCGLQQPKKGVNEAFRETKRAMTVYDKLSILEYHVHQIQKEVESPLEPST
jgi:hypothetical protein